jgi:hypothetical protein
MGGGGGSGGNSGGGGGAQDWSAVFNRPLDDADFAALAASGILGPSGNNNGHHHPGSYAGHPGPGPIGAGQSHSQSQSSRYPATPISQLGPLGSAWDAAHAHGPTARPSYAAGSYNQNRSGPPPQPQQPMPYHGRKPQQHGPQHYTNPFDTNSVPPGPISPPSSLLSAAAGFGTDDNPLMHPDWHTGAGGSGGGGTGLGSDPSLWPSSHDYRPSTSGSIGSLGSLGSGGVGSLGSLGASSYRLIPDGLMSPIDDPSTRHTQSFNDLFPDTLFPASPVDGSFPTDGNGNGNAGPGTGSYPTSAPRVREITWRMTALQLKKQQEEEERAAANAANAANASAGHSASNNINNTTNKEAGEAGTTGTTGTATGGRGRALNKGQARVQIIGFDDGQPDDVP